MRSRHFVLFLCLLLSGGVLAKNTKGFEDYRYRYKADKKVKIELAPDAHVEMKFKKLKYKYQNVFRATNKGELPVTFIYEVHFVDKAGEVVARSGPKEVKLKANDTKASTMVYDEKKKVKESQLRDILVKVLVFPQKKAGKKKK